MIVSKRGVAMMSFHWLLVIIAGGAIFILFSLFIRTGQTAAESSLSVDILLHFDTIFSSLVTTEKTEATLPSRDDIELTFSCRLTDQTPESALLVKGGARKDLNDIILFSRELVSGEEIYTVARNLAVPFSVSSLLYVTDPSVLYVVNANTPAQRNAIQSILPRNATVIRVPEPENPTLTTINFNDYRDVVIISNDGNAYNILSTVIRANAKTRMYYYGFTFDDDTFETGKIQGYTIKSASSKLTVTPDGDQLAFINDEMLAGIIMSDSAEWYRCVEKKLYDKLSRVAAILAAKAEILENEYAARNSICKSTYALAKVDLAEIKENPQNYDAYVTTIKSYNSRLELQSCPLLY